MARHLPFALRADAAAARGVGRADAGLHHPRHRRPDAPAQAGDGRGGGGPQALARAGDDGGDPALEGPRPRARGRDPGRGHGIRRRPRPRPLRAISRAVARRERLRLRRPHAAHGDGAARQPGGAGGVAPPLPLHPGRRVPGHEPGAVPLAATACAGAQEHLLRGRRRPVHILVAWRGDRKHPPLRARLPRRPGGAAGKQLPLDAPDPRRRLAPHRPQQRPARQDAPLRPQRRRGREGARRLACGTRRRRRAWWASGSRRRAAPASGCPRSPSWSAPASRPAPSRSG